MQLPQTLKQVAAVEYYSTIRYLFQQQKEFIIGQISFQVTDAFTYITGIIETVSKYFLCSAFTYDNCLN